MPHTLRERRPFAVLLVAVWACATVDACGGDRSLPTSTTELTSPAVALTPASITSALTIDFISVARYTPVLPAHYDSTVTRLDNTPGGEGTNDKVATLGRVLFYDKKLSVNDTTSCATCHQQALGFSDSAQFSLGFAGGRTSAHSPRLGNVRFYAPGRCSGTNGRRHWRRRHPSQS